MLRILALSKIIPKKKLYNQSQTLVKGFKWHQYVITVKSESDATGTSVYGNITNDELFNISHKLTIEPKISSIIHDEDHLLLKVMVCHGGNNSKVPPWMHFWGKGPKE